MCLEGHARLFYPGTRLTYNGGEALSTRNLANFDVPERVQVVLEMAKTCPELFICSSVEPSEGGCKELEAAKLVHLPEMIDFIVNVSKDEPIIPDTFILSSAFHKTSRLRDIPCLPQYAGAYCFDTWTPLTQDTVPAVLASVACCLHAVDYVLSPIANTTNVAYALCRTPGHHASKSGFGGFCYVNNAIVAAKQFLLRGMKEVVIIDIDFHFGNGTYDLVENMTGVHLVSVHADPSKGYEPYFGGIATAADEDGKKSTSSKVLNLVYDPLTINNADFFSLLSNIRIFTQAIYDRTPAGCCGLVVSLGVDALKDDPLHPSGCGWEEGWYWQAGTSFRHVAGNGPIVVVHEGGYNVEKCAGAVQQFFRGLCERRD